MDQSSPAAEWGKSWKVQVVIPPESYASALTSAGFTLPRYQPPCTGQPYRPWLWWSKGHVHRHLSGLNSSSEFQNRNSYLIKPLGYLIGLSISLSNRLSIINRLIEKWTPNLPRPPPCCAYILLRISMTSIPFILLLRLRSLQWTWTSVLKAWIQPISKDDWSDLSSPALSLLILISWILHISKSRCTWSTVMILEKFSLGHV